MLCGIGGQRLRQQGKVISPKRVWDEQDPMVRAEISEELKGEANEIVPVPGDQTASVVGGPLELLPIGPSEGADLVRADRIQAPSPKQLSDSGAEVLIQVKRHWRLTAKEGC